MYCETWQIRVVITKSYDLLINWNIIIKVGIFCHYFKYSKLMHYSALLLWRSTRIIYPIFATNNPIQGLY